MSPLPPPPSSLALMTMSGGFRGLPWMVVRTIAILNPAIHVFFLGGGGASHSRHTERFTYLIAHHAIESCCGKRAAHSMHAWRKKQSKSRRQTSSCLRQQSTNSDVSATAFLHYAVQCARLQPLPARTLLMTNMRCL